MLLCLTLPFYLGSAGWNSGTHALKESTVLPEPSSQPPPQYLYKYFFQNISPFKNTKASYLFDLNKTQREEEMEIKWMLWPKVMNPHRKKKKKKKAELLNAISVYISFK